MLKKTYNPSIIIKNEDYEIVNEKIKELEIEVISDCSENGVTSLHIYCEESTLNKLCEWLDKEFKGLAEIES